MKTIEFVNEIEVLDNVSLDQIKGGLQLTSYSGGCPENDHQATLSLSARFS